MSTLGTVMLFTGAPLPSTVDDSSCTIENFDSSLHSLLGWEESYQLPQHDSSHAAWRSLPLIRKPLHTGFSQLHRFEDSFIRPSNDFFNTYDGISKVDDPSFQDEEALTQFCEQSLALHNPIPSSQLEDSVDRSMTTTTTDGSFMSNDTFTSDPGSIVPPQLSCHLSHLKDIPPARQIPSLQPSVKTINLVVGVISIAQPRTVTTRWGTSLSLVEVLVGDESKCGFGITFWLSKDAALQSAVTMLRRQDVVLVRNIALHVFRNKVYGQSLRRGLTELSLLWRKDGGGHYSTRDLSRDEPSKHPQKEKARVVKNWVIQFVGGDIPLESKRSKKSWDDPPDDSQ
ncbi:hypothetical protein V2G26_008984 [Clonostachys chloroleuca]